jgi:hypothetical protein
MTTKKNGYLVKGTVEEWKSELEWLLKLRLEVHNGPWWTPKQIVELDKKIDIAKMMVN